MSRPARVAIVGAGPQGLTAAAYLVCAGVDPLDVTVIDPAGAWLAAWRHRFARLGIAHLRSPAVHHPHPDPFALSSFAAAHRRDDELVRRYRLPSTELFADFCQHLIDGFGLADRVVADTVVEVGADGTVGLAGGATLRADHVVWATNPAVGTGPDHSGSTVRRWDGPGPVLPAGAATVAIVGGGLSAGHLVERAIEDGRHVEWVTRRRVELREFDTDPGWLGPKELRQFSMLTDPAERLERVLAARGGGTVPSWMLLRLHRHEAAGVLCRRAGTIALDAGVDGDGDDGRTVVRVDGRAVPADSVLLATGDRPDVAAAPPLHRLCRALGTTCLAGRPVLDPVLRLDGSVVHVIGRLAQLGLGPTAGNLAGARRAAELLVGAVVGTDAMLALADR